MISTVTVVPTRMRTGTTDDRAPCFRGYVRRIQEPLRGPSLFFAWVGGLERQSAVIKHADNCARVHHASEALARPADGKNLGGTETSDAFELP